MNKFTVGQEAKIMKCFSTKTVENFAKISGDTNPVHLNEDFANKTIFKKKIVHGFLYSSLISAVIGTKLPGNGSIYLHQELNFKKPVYHNENIIALVRITQIKKEKSLIYLDTFCYKDNNDIVVEGKAIVKVI
ncbi:MAG: enoyl-CoA hydratase [Flavobacteriaceae bacterium]|nr:enoyl-CoA hydratase [Flavobacteriaceae bacterium]|tara:strand:+ start:1353 stop:1751 length:399 start_codon:yes stop_codon:yes gene_type:complete